jgi:hypothetical protein
VENSFEFGIEPSGPTKCWEIFCVASQLGVSRVVLSSIELITYKSVVFYTVAKFILSSGFAVSCQEPNACSFY